MLRSPSASSGPCPHVLSLPPLPTGSRLALEEWPLVDFVFARRGALAVGVRYLHTVVSIAGDCTIAASRYSPGDKCLASRQSLG